MYGAHTFLALPSIRRPLTPHGPTPLPTVLSSVTSRNGPCSSLQGFSHRAAHFELPSSVRCWVVPGTQQALNKRLRNQGLSAAFGPELRGFPCADVGEHSKRNFFRLAFPGPPPRVLHTPPGTPSGTARGSGIRAPQKSPQKSLCKFRCGNLLSPGAVRGQKAGRKSALGPPPSRHWKEP